MTKHWVEVSLRNRALHPRLVIKKDGKVEVKPAGIFERDLLVFLLKILRSALQAFLDKQTPCLLPETVQNNASAVDGFFITIHDDAGSFWLGLSVDGAQCNQVVCSSSMPEDVLKQNVQDLIKLVDSALEHTDVSVQHNTPTQKRRRGK